MERLALVLRNTVVAPSDPTSCCTRIIRPLLPEMVSYTPILASEGVRKGKNDASDVILPVEGIHMRCIQSVVHPRILATIPPQIVVPA